MATTPRPAGHSSAQRPSLLARLQQFWQRVTEGLAISQLWSQFETETRSSYRLYSRDVQAKTPEGLTSRGRRLHVLKEFFWAVLEKLSPARRVLLLVALIMLMGPWDDIRYRDSSGGLHGIQFNSQFWAGLLLFLLLMLEIADRVVMKRDLQIAREIQTWLRPAHRRKYQVSRLPTPRARRTPSPAITTTSSRVRAKHPKSIA